MIRVMRIVLVKNKKCSSQGAFSVSSTSIKNLKNYTKSDLNNKNKISNNKFRNKWNKVNKHSSNGQCKDGQTMKKQIRDYRNYFKGFVGLIILMGITWISYILYIHQYGTFFSYVFIFVNGLQVISNLIQFSLIDFFLSIGFVYLYYSIFVQ